MLPVTISFDAHVKCSGNKSNNGIRRFLVGYSVTFIDVGSKDRRRQSSIATIATSRAWSIDFIRYLRQYRQTNRKIDRNRRRINCACGLVSKCKKSIAHSQLISYTINMVCV